MQLRFRCNLTGEEYVSQKAWRNASLMCCPLHPKGGCGITRHGTYERTFPPGTHVARWYCPEGRCTFSLLPDCLAARLPGTLAEVEAVVIAVEQARSLEAACEELRIDIDLPGALRWIRRRVKAIHLLLITLKGLIPEYFEGCEVNLVTFLQRIGVDAHLPALREIAAPHLSFLPSPLGFKPPRPRSGEPEMVLQHPMGPDPPAALA